MKRNLKQPNSPIEVMLQCFRGKCEHCMSGREQNLPRTGRAAMTKTGASTRPTLAYSVQNVTQDSKCVSFGSKTRAGPVPSVEKAGKKRDGSLFGRRTRGVPRPPEVGSAQIPLYHCGPARCLVKHC